MARLVSLVGTTDSGKIISVGVGDADDMIKLRKKVIDLEGVIKSGKTEVKLNELVCMSTATAGGELKPRRKFKALKKAKDSKPEAKEAE